MYIYFLTDYVTDSVQQSWFAFGQNSLKTSIWTFPMLLITTMGFRLLHIIF